MVLDSIFLPTNIFRQLIPYFDHPFITHKTFTSMNRTFIFLLLGLMSFSCTKEEVPPRLSTFETPVITGFEFRDNAANIIMIIGNPNNKLESVNTRSDVREHDKIKVDEDDSSEVVRPLSISPY